MIMVDSSFFGTFPMLMLQPRELVRASHLSSAVTYIMSYKCYNLVVLQT